MDLSFAFSEMERIVRESGGIELKFEYDSPKSMQLTYPVKVLGNICMKLQVLGITGNDVKVALVGSGMMNMAMGMVSKLVNEKLAGVATFGPNNDISVHLDKIDKLQPFLQKMRLTDICFNQTAAVVSMDMR